MKTKFINTLFWASTWGISEATIGYFLHLLPFNVGWVVWFPLAFFFMAKIYETTSDVRYILLSSLIASSIKLINLWMDIRIDHVINPIVSILVEGIAITIVYAYLEKKPIILKIFTINMIWRVLYLSYLVFMPDSFISISPLNSFTDLFDFLFLESIITGFIIGIILVVNKKIIKTRFTPSMSLAVLSLIIAIIIQVII